MDQWRELCWSKNYDLSDFVHLSSNEKTEKKKKEKYVMYDTWQYKHADKHCY